MKVFIVQELQEYKIYKVADELIAAFEAEKKDCIVVEGKSIADAIIQFDAMEKSANISFNSELVKYKTAEKENIESHQVKHKYKL